MDTIQSSFTEKAVTAMTLSTEIWQVSKHYGNPFFMNKIFKAFGCRCFLLPQATAEKWIKFPKSGIVKSGIRVNKYQYENLFYFNSGSGNILLDASLRVKCSWFSIHNISSQKQTTWVTSGPPNLKFNQGAICRKAKTTWLTSGPPKATLDFTRATISSRARSAFPVDDNC